jgi:hypothetical protein
MEKGQKIETKLGPGVLGSDGDAQQPPCFFSLLTALSFASFLLYSLRPYFLTIP